MGILERVADRFQQEASERPYECLQCGVRLDVEYYVCPSCGSFSVDRATVRV